jgi:hypothetical protein
VWVNRVGVKITRIPLYAVLILLVFGGRRCQNDLMAGIVDIAGRDGNGQRRDELKINVRGKDDAPLSPVDLNDGLYEAMRRLARIGVHAKSAALFLTLVDERGRQVTIEGEKEWTIVPPRTLAGE